MAFSRKAKVTAVFIVIIAAVAVYALLPYAVSSDVSTLQNNQTAYVYGTVQGRYALGQTSVFGLNTTSGMVYVIWNGTTPSIGEKVLVHGIYKGGDLFSVNIGVIEATSVFPWYI